MHEPLVEVRSLANHDIVEICDHVTDDADWRMATYHEPEDGNNTLHGLVAHVKNKLIGGMLYKAEDTIEIPEFFVVNKHHDLAFNSLVKKVLRNLKGDCKKASMRIHSEELPLYKLLSRLGFLTDRSDYDFHGDWTYMLYSRYKASPSQLPILIKNFRQMGLELELVDILGHPIDMSEGSLVLHDLKGLYLRTSGPVEKSLNAQSAIAQFFGNDKMRKKVRFDDQDRMVFPATYVRQCDLTKYDDRIPLKIVPTDVPSLKWLETAPQPPNSP